jgi:FAD/FMN-containing dehydrogenase
VLEPAALRLLSPEADGAYVAEIGVGVVHTASASAVALAAADEAASRVGARIKHLFDPTGRMNPGREPRVALSSAPLHIGAR